MLASIDTTAGQFTADAVLIGLVALNAYLGWRFGLLRRIVGFAGLYFGCLAATNMGNAIASAVHATSVDANAWCFIVVLIVTVLTVEILGALYGEAIQKFAVIMFDRTAGLLSGFVVGLAQALVLFLVAFAVAGAPGGSVTTLRDRAAPMDAIQSATFAGQAVRIAPQVHAIFSPVLPDNLAAHLSEDTHTVTPAL